MSSPFYIYVDIFRIDGSRATLDDTSKIWAFDEEQSTLTFLGELNPTEVGRQQVFFTHAPHQYPGGRLRPNVQLQLFSSSNLIVHTTNIYPELMLGSTIKVILGEGDSLLGIWTVRGTVTDAETSDPVTTGSVQVLLVSGGSTIDVGSATLDASGEYELVINEQSVPLPVPPPPTFIARYKDSSGAVRVQSTPTTVIGQEAVIDLSVPAVDPPGPDPDPMQYIVRGFVRNLGQAPLPGQVVQATQLNWISTGIQETSLGRALTDARGYYEIAYFPSTLEGTCSPVNEELTLVVQVVTGTVETPGDPIVRSDIVSPVRLIEEVHLTLDQDASSDDSEYAWIDRQVRKCLSEDEFSFQAVLYGIRDKQGNLEFAARATEVDADALLAYVRAYLLAGLIQRDVQFGSGSPPISDYDPFPAEALFALTRLEDVATIADALAVEPDQFLDSVTEAIRRGAVASAFEERLPLDADPSLTTQWGLVRAHYLSASTVPEYLKTDEYRLLELVLLEAKRRVVAERRGEFRGDFAEFVAFLLEDEALTEQEAEDLLFVFEFYAIAEEHFPIVAIVYGLKATRGWHTVGDLASVTRRAEGGVDGWDEIALAEANPPYSFPEGIVGRTNAEKASAHGRRLYEAFTRDLGEARFANDFSAFADESSDPATEDAAAFLQGHPELNLEETNIEGFLTDHEISLSADVVDKLKQVQRVRRLTPKFEEAQKLLAAGLDSSVKIARIPEQEFITNLEEDFDGDVTTLQRIHRTAQRYASGVFSQLVRFNEHLNDVGGTEALSPFSVDQTLQETPEGGPLYAHYTTLFGNLFSCAARHCETVLSPAAYFVDLLEFLEGRPKRELFARRPDLAELELSCENTEKALPYIDLVIETLSAALAPWVANLRDDGESIVVTQSDLDTAAGENEAASPEDVAAALAKIRGLIAAAGYRVTPYGQVRKLSSSLWALEDDAVRWKIRLEGATYVARGALQTSPTAELLEVFPEHENVHADAILSAAVFPFQLPLALGRQEIELILGQRGVTRSEAIRAFPLLPTPTTAAPPARALVADPAEANVFLSLTDDEATAILSSTLEVHEYWGFPDEDVYDLPRPEDPSVKVSGHWRRVLSQVSFFLDRSQLTYKELLDLLATEYIHDPAQPLVIATADDEGSAEAIENAQECNYYRYALRELVPPDPEDEEDEAELVVPAEATYRRISFFLRLRRVLGWDLNTLDRYLVLFERGGAPSASTAPPADLLQLAWFLQISRWLSLDPRDVLSFFADLDTRSTTRLGPSLFDRALLAGPRSAFGYQLLQRIGAGQSGAATAVHTEEELESLRSAVRAAVRLPRADFDVLWAAEFPNTPTEFPPAEEFSPTLAQLSSAVRVATFARSAGISAEELYLSDDVLGVAPFTGANVADQMASTAASFFEWGKLKASGLSLRVVDYLLRHPDDHTLEPTLAQLDEVRRLASAAAAAIEQKYPVTLEPDTDTLTTLLSEVMPLEKIPLVLAELDKPYDAGPPETGPDKALLERYFVAFAGDDVESFVDALVELPPDERGASLATSLRGSLIERARRAAALTLVVDTFGLPAATADFLLNQALSSSVDPEDEKALDDWAASVGAFELDLEQAQTLLEEPEPPETGDPRFRSYWVAEADGDARFLVDIEGTDVTGAEVALSLGGALPTESITLGTNSARVVFGPVSLRAGEVRALELSSDFDFSETGSRLGLTVQLGYDEPRAVAPSWLTGFGEAGYVKLQKAALLITGLGLDTVELEELARRDAEEVDVEDRLLDGMPLDDATPDVPWARLAAFLGDLAIHRRIDLGEEQSLFQLLGASAAPGTTDVAELTGWKEADVAAALDLLWEEQDPPGEASFGSIETWKVVERAVGMAQRLDLRLERAVRLLRDEAPTSAVARALRELLRAQYTPETYAAAFKPGRDLLRQAHRDALVGYLTSHEVTLGGGARRFVSENELFSYFLIDVEMEPDTQISRLRLALSVIQLFVQRIFLGLEPRATFPNPQRALQEWEWRQQYRVWEANRKVFLYPENWIEPQLRDDKTELFTELEEELLQDDVDDEAAQKILARYVHKLGELAQLVIVGMHTSGGTTYLVGRDRVKPYAYYHRRFARTASGNVFTPWKKVPLEIDADFVAPVLVSGSLWLFWPMIREKQKVANGEENLGSAVTIQVLWSKLDPKTGEWSKPRLGDGKVVDEFAEVVFDRAASSDKPNTGVYQLRAAVKERGDVRIDVLRSPPLLPHLTPLKDEEKAAQREVNLRSKNVELLNTLIEGVGSVVSDLKALYNEQLKEAEDQLAQARERLATAKKKLKLARQVPRPQEGRTAAALVLGYVTVSSQGDEASTARVAYSYVGLMSASGEVRNNAIQRSAAPTMIKSNTKIRQWLPLGENPQDVYLGARAAAESRLIVSDVGYSTSSSEFAPFVFETGSVQLLGTIKTTFPRVGKNNGVRLRQYKLETIGYPVFEQVRGGLRGSGAPGIMNRLTQALPTSDRLDFYTYSQYAGNVFTYYAGGVYLGYYRAGDGLAKSIMHHDFRLDFEPNTTLVALDYPKPTIQFDYGSAFGVYNWELFFHLPMLVADRLAQQMRYEEALQWLHYVFDPRQDLNFYEKPKKWAQNLPAGARYWNFLPFFANRDVKDSLLDVLGANGALRKDEQEALQKLIRAWEADPFSPHLIARQRIGAYQKFVVMKYLDTLIAWGDELFRADTIESINQATQLYILASDLLGDRPEVVEPVGDEPRASYSDLERNLDVFNNAAVELEALSVGAVPVDTGGEANHPALQFLSTTAIDGLFFRIPRNDKFDGYWDTVQDRLFKIRNSMNIDGVKRSLALFEPPIDPALLVRARAAGVDLSSALSQLNRPLPYHRFSIWIGQAKELAGELRSFGAAILSALEKKDAEDLALLRQRQELQLLDLVRQVRQDQVSEAERQVESLRISREMAENRLADYSSREYISERESQSLSLADVASGLDISAGLTHAIGGALAVVPEGTVGAFSATVTFGGRNLHNNLSGLAAALSAASSVTTRTAGKIATVAGYDRRLEDWQLQISQAEIEMRQIEQQIVAAEIRAQIAQKELDNHLLQIEQSQEVQDFMHRKFTNSQLYQWMITELNKTYQQVYRLAYDVAKTAERTFAFELGESPHFIQFEYRDSARKGLLAGEKLLFDLKRLEVAYLERHKRELEITKSISLGALDPAALQALRETGKCTFDVPEVLFDLDFPGQYFRRIRAVRLTIPCVTGPYTSVSARLSLLSSAIRVKSTSGPEYAYQGVEDTRFAHDTRGIQSIATSTAQDDAGLFELNFRDERYLPFEGAGVISQWSLELPAEFRQFDYSTISDVVVQLSYTAREAGGTLKLAAEGAIRDGLNGILELASEETGLVRVFSLKREFPDALHQLLTTNATTITLRREHFPYMLRSRPLVVFEGSNDHVQVIVEAKGPVSSGTLKLTVDDSEDDDQISVGTSGTSFPEYVRDDLQRHGDELLANPSEPGTEVWALESTNLDVDNVEDVLFVLRYAIDD